MVLIYLDSCILILMKETTYACHWYLSSYSLPQDVKGEIFSMTLPMRRQEDPTLFIASQCVLLNGPAKNRMHEGLLPSTIGFLEFGQNMNFMDVSATFLSTESTENPCALQCRCTPVIDSGYDRMYNLTTKVLWFGARVDFGLYEFPAFALL